MYAGAQRVLAAERTIAAMIDGPRNRLFRKGMFGARPLGTITVFLHRHQAHRALDLHPAVSHFFRLWLWLTTGRVTKEWAAIHRKHHAKVETPEDPHSPQVVGINRVLLFGIVPGVLVSSGGFAFGSLSDA